ncbi:MAG: MBOAT family protein, partial [Candidatus Adiutrix sp.]|jgi:alginate O-acetyltransferase complex protein AlgI|nr:MBOAT family protein [Candidatus Adiutrix sp.]
VANVAAPLADTAFLAGVHNFGDAWLGAAAYTIQIYFDFSAYSDMAIGLAAMAGFRFEENFRRPYSASSIRDFWRRWHISLSSWLRDYLYIPLGGSRKGEGRTLLNLLIVFFLCGLWHGAEFTFIIWGLWHGLFLMLERLWLGRRLAALPVLCGRVYTMLVVMVGWVFFRAADLDEAWNYLAIMFNHSAGNGVPLAAYRLALIGLAAGIVICLWPDRLLPWPDSRSPENFSGSAMLVQGLLFFPSLTVLVSGLRNPFIYFNF